MKKLLFIALLYSPALFAQTLQTDTVPAIINYKEENGTTRFSSQLRELRPIAGAPAPFFTYFWEFGDGTFSFEKDPVHVYPDSGKYDVRLFATNNYDDGKRPPTRPKPIKKTTPKSALASNGPSGFFKSGGSIAMKTNCMPKPGDDMMLVMGYRNKSENLPQRISGTIAILYNDKEFSKDNFVLAETRVYHGETKTDLKNITATVNAAARSKKTAGPYYASLWPEITRQQIAQLMADAAQPVRDELLKFKSSEAWSFKDLKAGAEQFVFMHFKTTPEMVKDTNAVVRLTGVYLPDDPILEKEIFSIELQIVNSHDPNKMSIRKSRMNYRLTGKNRELTYRVRFQNTGKGPAKKVDVGVSLSKVFDPATVKVNKTKPEVASCNGTYANQSCLNTVFAADSVHFIFSNIYLPGTTQEGVNDADSTMGFVEYKVKFKEKPDKLPINTGAAIVFDKNEPIYTNRATGKFKAGISPAPIIGYGFAANPGKGSFLDQKSLIIGASIAPFSPYRKYLQAELFISAYNTVSETASVDTRKDTVIDKLAYQITRRDRTAATRIVTINLVPASIHYNLGKFVGVGAGAMVSADLSSVQKKNFNYALTGFNGASNTNIAVAGEQIRKSFSDVHASAFADILVGLARVGPAVGFRYFFDPGASSHRMGTYVTWKF